MPITQNGALKKDDNDLPVMGGTSSSDNATIVNSSFNPTTRRLLTDSAASSFGLLAATGTVDGSNTSFTFTSAPSVIVVDQGRSMQKTSSDGTSNWSGTTSVTLVIAPTFDIFGLG